MSITVIIPARWASVRFPGKMLHPIMGMPLVHHVYERAISHPRIDQVLIATDDQRIYDSAMEAGYRVEMSRADHQSGTDRCAELAERIDSRYVINVQGDEPLLAREHLDVIIAQLEAGASIATLCTPIKPNHALDPNRVKVVRNQAGKALYFSRAAIPYDRSKLEVQRDQHIGIYGFQRETLLALARLDQSPLELAEGLEQLRWMDHGYEIHCGHTTIPAIGVDVLEDVAAVETMLRENK